MPVKMKALKTFRGRPGEGKDRLVQADSDFTVNDQQRADDLERRGLAVPEGGRRKSEKAPKNKAEQAPKNKAASKGPLTTQNLGGVTGTAKRQQSSRQARQPKAKK